MKEGYVLQTPAWCLLTSLKLICDFTKQEFCASKVADALKSPADVVPVCRPRQLENNIRLIFYNIKEYFSSGIMFKRLSK